MSAGLPLLRLSLLVSILATCIWGQEDIVDRTPLGKKASPFLAGPKPIAGAPAFAVFSKMGIGYHSNVYRSPYHFDASAGGEATRQFPTSINLPQSDFPLYGNVGGEMAMLLGQSQSLRLITAGQYYHFPVETLKTVGTFNAFGAYRFDISRLLRLDMTGQADIVKGKSTLIFGQTNYLTWDEFLNAEGVAELSAYTVPATFIGRGRTQIMGAVRFRDYGEPVRSVYVRDSVPYVPGYDDSLELDYIQVRGRVRHTQGLVRGLSLVFSGDYLWRDYDGQRAKMTEAGKMAKVPLDTNGNPTGPLRKEHQVRTYGGIRFDAPHVKRFRITAGVENIRNIDPFQGFYSYDQWALRLSTTYQPRDAAYSEFAFATKVRSYEKLKANLNLAFSYPPPSVSDGEPIAVGDTTWKSTKLETTMLEMRWRGQVPVTGFLALWAAYNIDMRISNRLTYEIQSREYFDQRISGGVVLYFRSDRL